MAVPQMTGDSFAEPSVIETQATCPGLARLPSLPVRVLVLSAPELDDRTRKGLAERLVRRSQDLGVGEGVAVASEALASWDLAPGGTGRLRFDVLILRLADVPADPERSDEPAEAVVAALGKALADLGTRLWVFEPCRAAPEGDGERRRHALCRRLVGAGAPPAVALPAGWDDAALLQFHEDFLEWILHDAVLAKAVSRATGSRRPVPTVFQPAGGRFGLDLGRLLEEHRKSIDEECIALRILKRELEAVRPAASGPQGDVWIHLDEAASRRLEALERVRFHAEEINRDRDPAGWSRLASNIEDLRAIRDEGLRGREQLAALRLIERDRSPRA